VRNSIHFEVLWRTAGSKAKSIYMKKPPHYLVYQLLLDIQAQTGFPADKRELSLGGTTLAWHDRLSSAGVVDGEVLVLKVSSPWWCYSVSRNGPFQLQMICVHVAQAYYGIAQSLSA
jgi:hypothetical protein